MSQGKLQRQNERLDLRKQLYGHQNSPIMLLVLEVLRGLDADELELTRACAPDQLKDIQGALRIIGKLQDWILKAPKDENTFRGGVK